MVTIVDQPVEGILAARGQRVASVNAGRWLNLPARRFEAIYFPAQRIHVAQDEPRASADSVLPNDPRLIAGGPPSGAPPP